VEARTHAHRLHYRNFQNERVVRDIVPVSALGHCILHAWLLWSSLVTPPSRLPVTWGLRCSCQALAVVVRPWLAVQSLGLLVAGIAWRVLGDLVALVARSIAELRNELTPGLLP